MHKAQHQPVYRTDLQLPVPDPLPAAVRVSVPMGQWSDDLHIPLLRSLPSGMHLSLCLTALPTHFLPRYKSKLLALIAALKDHFDDGHCPEVLFQPYASPSGVVDFSSPADPADFDGSTLSVFHPVAAGIEGFRYFEESSQPIPLSTGGLTHVDSLRGMQGAIFATGRPVIPVTIPELPPHDVRIFVAYATQPPEVEGLMSAATQNLADLAVTTWRQLERARTGVLWPKLRKAIDASTVLLADFTWPSRGANVFYETAIAMAAGKPVYAVYHDALAGDSVPVSSVPFVADLELVGYRDAADLYTIVDGIYSGRDEVAPTPYVPVPETADRPEETEILIFMPKGDEYAADRRFMEDALKKSWFTPRFYDDGHQFDHALGVVHHSAGLVISFLEFDRTDTPQAVTPSYRNHNIPALFFTGFASGSHKPALILHCLDPAVDGDHTYRPFDLKRELTDGRHERDELRQLEQRIGPFCRGVSDHQHEAFRGRVVPEAHGGDRSLTWGQVLDRLAPADVFSALGPTREDSRDAADLKRLVDRFVPHPHPGLGNPDDEALYEGHRLFVLQGRKGEGKSSLINYEFATVRDRWKQRDPEMSLVVVAPFFTPKMVGRFPKLAPLATNGNPDTGATFWKQLWYFFLSVEILRKLDPDSARRFKKTGESRFMYLCRRILKADDHTAAQGILDSLSPDLDEIETAIRQQLGEERTRVRIYLDNVNHEWFMAGGGDSPAIVQGLLRALHDITGARFDSQSRINAVVGIHDPFYDRQQYDVTRAYLGLHLAARQIIELGLPHSDHLRNILSRRLHHTLRFPSTQSPIPFQHLWWHLASSHLEDGRDSWEYAAMTRGHCSGTTFLEYLRERLNGLTALPVSVSLLIRAGDG